MRSLVFPACGLLCLLTGAAARAEDWEGPYLGFTPDASAASVRLLRGIPGAATWAEPIGLGEAVSVAGISQRNSAAIVVGPEGVRTASLSPTAPPLLSDPGLPTAFRPSLTVFSPSGETAALYGDGALWILRKGSAVNVPVAGQAISRLAVSDGDRPLISELTESDAHSVLVFDTQGSQRKIEGFENITDISFVGDTRDLAIADSGARRLVLARDALGDSLPELLLGQTGYGPTPAIMFLRPRRPNPLHEGPLRIASSASGNALAVLAGDSQAGVLYLATKLWKQFACDCSNASPFPLRGNAVFGISHPGQPPSSVLDADSADPSLFFVPAEAQQ